MKAKLRRQVLVQKKRCFIQEPHCRRQQQTPLSETISLPAQACAALGTGRGGIICFYSVILLSFGALSIYLPRLLAAQALSIHVPSVWCPQALPIPIPSFWPLQAFSTCISIFWCAQCKHLPLLHCGGDSLGLPYYL